MAFGFAAKTAVVVMLVQVTPIAIADISWRYFLIFIFIDTIFGIGFYFWFPEVSCLAEIKNLGSQNVDCKYSARRSSQDIRRRGCNDAGRSEFGCKDRDGTLP
jgi:hypothetical protein